ncbi:MAG TPA: LamG-like jellyroll fold domain-containing protein [Nocardioidaceae bacterium]
MRLFVVGALLSAGVIAGVMWAVSLGAADPSRPVTRTQPPLEAVDSSGNGHDGVNQGRPSVGLPGRSGTSYSFHRDGSWVQVASNPRLNPQSRDFRVSAWINFSHRPVRRETYDIARKGLAFTPGGEFKLEIVPPGHVRCSAKDSSGATAMVTHREIDVADGAWHHVACARTGTLWSAVVDSRVVSQEVALERIGNTVAIAIGSKYGREDGVAGRVDEVKLAIARPGQDPATISGDRDERLKDLRRHHVVGLWHLDETPQETPVGQ